MKRPIKNKMRFLKDKRKKTLAFDSAIGAFNLRLENDVPSVLLLLHC
jgi:hypothetical protein